MAVQHRTGALLAHQLAQHDIYCRKDVGASVALRVIKATNAALDQIELDPGMSSPTLGKLSGIPGDLVGDEDSGALLLLRAR